MRRGAHHAVAEKPSSGNPAPPAALPTGTAGAVAEGSTAGGGGLTRLESDASSTASSAPTLSKESAAAAAKAAKEARKAAHLAAMPKKDDAEAKPKLSKAERRAQQEAQRAAKEAKKAAEGGAPTKKAAEGSHAEGVSSNPGGGAEASGMTGGGGGGGGEKGAAADKQNQNVVSGGGTVAIPSTRQAIKAERSARATAASKSRPSGKLVDHFTHLRQFSNASEKGKSHGMLLNHSVTMQAATTGGIHPAVARLAAHYSDGTITGGRARCVALLHTLKLVIRDFKTPENAKYAHALTTCVNSVVQHLQASRPMAVSMGNAIKSLKTHLARMSEEGALSEEDARLKTLKHLDYFEQEKLLAAGQFIAEHGAGEIVDGDVIVTHGASYHVREILFRAKRLGRKFHVTVVDSRPNLEGRDTLRRLLRAGIPCTYARLSSGLAYVLSKGGTTKVLMGAAAVLANGTVVSRVGTAAVAAVASHAGIPVLVAAETCKFHERVQLDAISNNELGNPGVLVNIGGVGGYVGGYAGGEGAVGDRKGEYPLKGWEESERLSVLNLTYDTTPAHCVTSVICESGLLEPTEVPRLLR